MSVDSSAHWGESMNRAPGGGVELEVFLRFAPNALPHDLDAVASRRPDNSENPNCDVLSRR